jgi:murein DD-endopeptidase MepM/ murein hydrolase activator NlpD
VRTVGWLFILFGVWLVRAAFKGQVIDSNGKFVLPDVVEETLVAIITGDDKKLRELDKETSGEGLLSPTPEESPPKLLGGIVGTDTNPRNPIKSPIDGGVVTYPFGVKNARYTAGRHTGVDYAYPNGRNTRGAPVKAVVAGRVLPKFGGAAYGTTVWIRGADGHTWLYAHLSSKRALPGMAVDVGQVIGKVGNSGMTGGFNHLHLEQSRGRDWHYNDVQNPTW